MACTIFQAWGTETFMETFSNATWYQGTADAVRKNMIHFMNHEWDYLLILHGRVLAVRGEKLSARTPDERVEAHEEPLLAGADQADAIPGAGRQLLGVFHKLIPVRRGLGGIQADLLVVGHVDEHPHGVHEIGEAVDLALVLADLEGGLIVQGEELLAALLLDERVEGHEVATLREHGNGPMLEVRDIRRRLGL